MPRKQILSTIVILSLTLPLSFCTASKQASTGNTEKEAVISSVSYLRDLQPIMLEKCTPCHFPEAGKKKMLDTYAATSESIADILERIQLPDDDPAFMPFRGKKPALTAEEIELFIDWANGSMPE